MEGKSIAISNVINETGEARRDILRQSMIL